MRWTPESLVLTCEHAVSTVPVRHADLFAGAARTLCSHRGFDRGALEVARALARRLRAPLLAGQVTRLLVDLNRSEEHPDCFSRYTDRLSDREKGRLLDRYHRAHRTRVRTELTRAFRGGAPVLHLSVHSFAPVRAGKRRRVDLGILYDPAHTREKRCAEAWKRALRASDTPFRVRSNQPYRGTSDGLTTTLRGELPPAVYLGLELEINQRFWRPRSRRTDALIGLLETTLGSLLSTPMP